MLGKAPSGRESNTRFRQKPPRRASILSADPALDYHARFARRNFGESRMLNVMRDNLRHLKWVLVVVALAMLGYLGSYFDTRQRADTPTGWAAKIDGEAIP